ncbi:hypothetical protein BraRD5C2_67430 [Bradyrhizobium sp. RD5-C2]|nr:hypothetical protein BraRD5C2_67430 [Bradyrhizobium sp. RD5-C2]
MAEIRPIVAQAFPDPAGALRDVGCRVALAMHLKVLIGAIAKKPRTAWSEIGKPADVLLGRQRGSLMEVNCGHVLLPVDSFLIPLAMTWRTKEGARLALRVGDERLGSLARLQGSRGPMLG